MDVPGRPPEELDLVDPEHHQTARVGEVPCGVEARQPVLQRELNNPRSEHGGQPRRLNV